MAKVLLIDDEPLYYRMMQPVFKEEGHELRYAKNGMEGLAEVSTFLPDLKLLRGCAETHASAGYRSFLSRARRI
jgi:DNA-binding response OmpR family regulator